MDTVWGDKIEKHVKIEAETFAERNSVGKNYKEMKSFSVPAGKAIHGIIVSGELRIVTEAANEEVAKVHHRQPQLVDS